MSKKSIQTSKKLYVKQPIAIDVNLAFTQKQFKLINSNILPGASANPISIDKNATSFVEQFIELGAMVPAKQEVKVTKHFHQRLRERFNYNDSSISELFEKIIQEIKNVNPIKRDWNYEKEISLSCGNVYKFVWCYESGKIILVTFMDDGTNFNRFCKKEILRKDIWEQILNNYKEIFNGGIYE